MATTNTTTSISGPSDQVRSIAGALKCLDMLRQLEESCGKKSDYSPAIYAARCLSDARTIIDGLGPMTPEQEGFIACLIEYAQESIEFESPCVELGWKGYSAMTGKERQAMVEQQEVWYEDANAAIEQTRKAAGKVVVMAEWRAAQ